MPIETIEPTEIESPRWQAVGLVLDQNARDLRTRRYGRLQEVVGWFKGIDLFRQAELERMIERKPTPLDKALSQDMAGRAHCRRRTTAHGSPPQRRPASESLRHQALRR